jgi:hypothetical protein
MCRGRARKSVGGSFTTPAKTPTAGRGMAADLGRGSRSTPRFPHTTFLKGRIAKSHRSRMCAFFLRTRHSKPHNPTSWQLQLETELALIMPLFKCLMRFAQIFHFEDLAFGCIPLVKAKMGEGGIVVLTEEM